MGPSNLANLTLGQLADGQQHFLKSGFGCSKEHVALIFVLIDPTADPSVITVTHQSGMVPTGHVRRADLSCVFMKPSELKPVIAADTWIGGSSGVIFGSEIVNDTPKVFAEVQYVEGNIQGRCNPTGIFGIVDRAAALMTDSVR